MSLNIIQYMSTITDGPIPGTIPGGDPATTTAGIHPGTIHTHGTIPGGMTHGMDGAGEIPSGTVVGHGTIPGTHLAGMHTRGDLTTAITTADGIITDTMDITILTARSHGATAAAATAVRHTAAAMSTAIIPAQA